MITQDMIGEIVGQHAYDRDGEKIGRVGQVYVDDRDGSPVWATVNTGLFGMHESFVPLADAVVRDQDLRLAVSKDKVKDAPRIEDSAQHLDRTEQDRLDRHYGTADRGARAGRMSDAAQDRTGDRRLAGADDGRETDASMTRSEERLRVGTTSEEVGTARLRKYVVTEQQTVTVPVSHDEVRIEREPVRDGEHAGPAAIGEDSHEVTLHAERPVVDKEVHAVEQVRLGTETVTEDKAVSDEIRKEQIEFAGPDGTTRRDER